MHVPAWAPPFPDRYTYQTTYKEFAPSSSITDARKRKSKQQGQVEANLSSVKQAGGMDLGVVDKSKWLASGAKKRDASQMNALSDDAAPDCNAYSNAAKRVRTTVGQATGDIGASASVGSDNSRQTTDVNRRDAV